MLLSPRALPLDDRTTKLLCLQNRLSTDGNCRTLSVSPQRSIHTRFMAYSVIGALAAAACVPPQRHVRLHERAVSQHLDHCRMLT